MDSNFPQDLLDLKNRIDHWRLTRRFVREALPAELREAIIQILSRHPVSLIKKALKLDPYRFRTSSVNTSSAARPATTVQRKPSVIRRDFQNNYREARSQGY